MSRYSGVSLPLSRSRRFVCDIMRLARNIPIIAARRRMNLAKVVTARATHPARMGWSSIFLKAYALTAAGVPELRRSYLSLPWPRLFEHIQSVAALTVERNIDGENAVLVAQIASPDLLPLTELERRVRLFKTGPLELIAGYRHMARLARLPRHVRSAVMTAGLNVGPWRARYFGTFGVSSVAGLGAEMGPILSPLTTTLNYGPSGGDGVARVTLCFDHRVLDGGTAARALARLEEVLCGEITAELCDLPLRRAA